MEHHIQLLLHYLLGRLGHAGTRAAMLVKITDGFGFNVRYLGVEGELSSETAAANVLCQKLTSGQAKGMILILTYPPTEWCLGLMWARFIEHIYYLDAGVIHHIGRERNPRGPSAATKEWALYAGADTDLKKWYQEKFKTVAEGTRMWDAYQKVVGAPPAILSSDPIRELKSPFLECLPGEAPVCGSATFRDGLLMKLAFALVGTRGGDGLTKPQTEGGLKEGNNVGAVLADSSGRILGWSVNIASENPSLHAECALIRTLLMRRRFIPKGLRLYTTLEPCHMCAGLISTCCSEWVVFFGQKDPAIENTSLERCAGSARQQKLCGSSVRAVEAVWKNLVAELGEEPDTLEFLKSAMAVEAFKRLHVVPDRMGTNLRRVRDTGTLSVLTRHASSSNVTGRLDLELPGGPVANRPIINRTAFRTESETIGGLNLDLPARSFRRPQSGTTLLPDLQLESELAMTQYCVELLVNLRKAGLIPPNH